MSHSEIIGMQLFSTVLERICNLIATAGLSKIADDMTKLYKVVAS